MELITAGSARNAGCPPRASLAGLLDSDNDTEPADGDAMDNWASGAHPNPQSALRSPAPWEPVLRLSSAPLTGDALEPQREDSQGAGAQRAGSGVRLESSYGAGSDPNDGGARSGANRRRPRGDSGAGGGGAMRRSGRSAPDVLAKRASSGGLG
jgi:hypothetical protein